ncbi:imelysin family protein [Mangrovicoccus algicola]|uniref:Imelysin family protein n=1 Tax=Mangrovicoccus algicola TaxID=2771008 RepID=A0A8J7CMJ7_9RHOB|nr:imelysin family protein [Mangrovicoccus algicola]MBE3640516.1 imelysin family protein [Mangrovicoccus algicola]
MRSPLFALCLALCPVVAAAAPTDVLQRAVTEHVQPGFDALARDAEALEQAAGATCDPADPELRAAFGTAWDDWIRISHLRFGPAEVDNRAFSLGLWPDARGFIPRTLQGLIDAEDPVIDDPAGFAEVSIAAHGFTALEFLLYDPQFAGAGDYGCRLLRRVAADIAATSAAIAADWRGPYAAAFLHPAPDAPYRSETEALGALYTAAMTGLQFTIEARLGRPMGEFDNPRPTRAEARRSGRSLRHVALSLEGTGRLALILAEEDPREAAALQAAYDRAVLTLGRLEDPALGEVADPMGRFRVEAAQQRIGDLREAVRAHVGGPLGLAEGFNSQDGD